MSDIANAIVEQGLEAGYPPEKIADALNKFRMDIHAGVEKEWAHPETIWQEKDKTDVELQQSMDTLRSRAFQDAISKSLGSDEAIAAFRAKLGTDAKLDESEQNAFDGAQKIISDAKFNLGSDVIRDRYNIGQNRLFDYEMRAAPNGELQARVRFGKRGETADITLPDVTDGDVKAMAEGRRKDAANALASAEKEAKKLSGLIDATENLYDIRNIRESAAAKAAELNKEADVLESPVGMEFARKSKLFDELRKPEYRHQIGGSDLEDYADSLLKGVAQQGLGIATTATMPFSEEKARSIRDLSRNIGETAGAYGVEFSGSGLEKGFANSAESVGNMAPAIILGAMGAGEVAAIESLAPGTFGQQYNDTLNRADKYEKQGNAAMAKTLRDRAVVKAFVDTHIELGSEGLFPLFSKLGQGGIVGAGKRIIQENAEEIAGLAAKNIISDPITGEKTGYGDIPETIRDTTGATALMELGGMAANKFAGQRVQAQSARANAPSLETGESIVPPVPAAPEAPPVIAAEVIEPEILPPPTPPMSEGAAVEVGGMREAPPMQEVPPTPAAAPPPPQTEAPPPPPPSFTAAAGMAATFGGTEAAKHVAAAQAIVDGVVPPVPKSEAAPAANDITARAAPAPVVSPSATGTTPKEAGGVTGDTRSLSEPLPNIPAEAAPPVNAESEVPSFNVPPPSNQGVPFPPPPSNPVRPVQPQAEPTLEDAKKVVTDLQNHQTGNGGLSLDAIGRGLDLHDEAEDAGATLATNSLLDSRVSDDNQLLLRKLVSSTDGRAMMRAALEQAREQQPISPATTAVEKPTQTGGNTTDENAIRSQEGRQGQGRQEGLLNSPAATSAQTVAENAPSAQESEKNTERYWTIDDLDVLSKEGPAKKRGTFPRFLVKVDDKTTAIKTPQALAKFLSSVRSHFPRVFKNTGKGVTIDFDISRKESDAAFNERATEAKPERRGGRKLPKIIKTLNGPTGDKTQPHVLDYLYRNPIPLPPENVRKESGEWDWLGKGENQSVPFFWRQIIFNHTKGANGRGRDVTSAIDELKEAGYFPGIANPTPEDLGRLIQTGVAEWDKARSTKGAPTEEEQRESSAEQQRIDFEKATESGPITLDPNTLAKGDVLIIEGERATVTNVEFDEDGNTTSFTIRDGTKFGVQTIDGELAVHVDDYQPVERSAGEFVPEDLQATKRSKAPTKEGEQTDMFAGKPDEPFNLFSETKEEREAREKEEDRIAKKKADEERERARIEAEKAQMGFDLGEENNGAPGAAAASEFKESTAGKYWRDDFVRAARAEPLIYRISPGKELEELTDRFVKNGGEKGDLPAITNDLLTKTNNDLGFTEREYGYLVGSAMLEWEGRVIDAESHGADDTIVDPMREKAAALYERYQDIYNRAGSVLQSAGHLERRDPLMRLRASFQKAEEARGKKTEEAAVKATGTTPDELGKEIKTNADAEIKKQAETKTAEVEKTPAAKTAVQQAKDAIKKKVDAIRRKLTGKNESAARAKSIKEAESKLANFRSKLEKDGAAGVANAFFRDDPLPAKPGPLVQSSDDLRSELSGLLNEALDKLGIERVSEKRTPEEEYKRIVATLGLDDLRLGKMNEIDKLVNERIDKIAENDPDRAEALLERWEQVSAAMIDNGVSGSTMRRVINLTLAEKGVSVGELSRMLPTDREKMIDEVAQTIRERVQKAGTPESAGTTAAALRNVHDITKSTVKEMLQSHAENQKTARTRTTSPTTKAQLASANLAERFSDTPPSLAPKAKPEDAMREMIKRAIAEGVPENFAKQLQDMGVSESAAVSLTNSVTNARNQAVKVAVEKARQAFLDRFKPRAKRPSPEHVDKLVKMVLEGQVHGVLGAREFADAVAKTMGVEPNRMNPAKIKELERIAVKARSLKVGTTERMDLEQDIQDELRLHAGLSTMDLIRAGWYQNILNAFGTQAVNIKGDIAQMTGALYQALGDALVGDPRAFGRLLSAWGRAFKPSVGGFMHTLQTGRSHKGGFKYGDTSASELAARGWDNLPAHQKAIYHGMLQGVQKYGMRFMSGVDVMFNQMAREAGAALAAGRAVRERGLKPGTQAFNVEFAKEMGLDGGKYLIAMQEAQKELRASGRTESMLEIQRRALEKVNRSRSESNQDASLRFSDRSTYQFDPEGTGYYISAMIDLLHRVPVIGRAAQAFNRIIANVVYENLDYTGLGLIRGALGTPITEMRGDKKGGKFLAPKKQVIYDSGERRERALKGAMGITLGSTLWAIANAFKDRPDDDKMPLMFYGYGPKSKKERAVWLKAGNRPYSYRIGSRVVPYQESQMAYPLAIVGAFMDRQRYGDDDDNTVSAMAALGDAARSIFYFGPLSNIKKLVDSVDAEGGGLANGIADVAANAARGLIPFSSALREAESIISPEMTNTKTKGLAGVAHKVMSGIPEASQFAPVALDVFGKPQVVSGLPGVRRIIGTSQPTEDLTRWLLANKAYPNMPPIIHEWAPGEPIAKKGAEPLDPANMEAKSFDLARISALYLTPEEQMVFLKARGAAIETGLRNVMEKPPESQKALAKMLQSTADDSLNSTAKMAGIKAVIEMHR